MEFFEELERRLHDPAVRRDRAQVHTLLADEFREFGSSGRIYDKDLMLELLQKESTPLYVLSAEGFATQELAENVVLLTYVSTRTNLESGDIVRALRSSVWVKRSGLWQMYFHQGTPIP